MVYKSISVYGFLLLIFYCTIPMHTAISETNEKRISIEKAQELKRLFCETQLVGKEDNFNKNPIIIDTFYVFPGNFYFFKRNAIKNGIWINSYSGMVFYGKKNVDIGEGWKPDQ